MTRNAQAIDRTLEALADPHRRRVVDLLSERPTSLIGELAKASGIRGAGHEPASARLAAGRIGRRIAS